MSLMRNNAGLLVFAAVCAAALWGMTQLFALADMPEVHTSYSTGKCVRVINSDGSRGSCANLPTRYHNTWVQ